MTKLARITKAYKRGKNLAMSIHVHLCYLIKHLCKCTFNNHFYRSLITQTCIFHICIQSQFHFVMPKMLVPFLKKFFFAVLLISFLSKWIGQQGVLGPGLLDCMSFHLRARVSLSIGPISMLHWLRETWRASEGEILSQTLVYSCCRSNHITDVFIPLHQWGEFEIQFWNPSHSLEVPT